MKLKREIIRNSIAVYLFCEIYKASAKVYHRTLSIFLLLIFKYRHVRAHHYCLNTEAKLTLEWYQKYELKGYLIKLLL